MKKENNLQALEEKAKIALDLVRAHSKNSYGLRECIEYGIKNAFYTQEQVDAAQKEYLKENSSVQGFFI